jgi:hypothetical protein
MNRIDLDGRNAFVTGGAKVDGTPANYLSRETRVS